MRTQNKNVAPLSRFQIHTFGATLADRNYEAMVLATDEQGALARYVEDCPEDKHKIFSVTPLAGDVFL